jgi:hypothetical protein
MPPGDDGHHRDGGRPLLAHTKIRRDRDCWRRRSVVRSHSTLDGLLQKGVHDPTTAQLTGCSPTVEDMTIQRTGHVGVVVDDLSAAIAFFVELRLELEGEAAVEGRWVDRVVGPDDVRVDVAMVRRDAHGPSSTRSNPLRRPPQLA